MPQARLSFLIPMALAVLTGCGPSGPEVNYVEGKVTLDGQPLEGATVTFSPVEGGTGRAASGVTDASGVYKLTDMQSTEVGSGVAAGEYNVGITKVTPPPQEDPEAWKNDPNYGNENYNPRATAKLDSEIPLSYKNPQTSGLKASVQPGENLNVNFELTASP